jgi:hypothetical protein
LVALDRTRQVAFAERHPPATRMRAAEFLRRVLEKLPYNVPTVLPDNGVPFTLQSPQVFPGGHRFDRVCRAFGVAHRLTRPAPPLQGQVERFHRPLKEAPGQRYHYQTRAQLNEPLPAFLRAYHHAKRLKRRRGLPPPEVVWAQWQKNPASLTRYPTHLTLALYS